MPESLTSDLVDLRDRVAALALEVLVPLAGSMEQNRAELRAAVSEASRGAGLFPMTQPAAVGGLAASALELTVARETLGSYNVAHLPGLFGPSPGLLAEVDEPLRTRFLLPLLAGEKQAGFGFTEPGDVSRPTWAVAAGKELVVNGQKSYVTGGADADFINTLVNIEGSGPAMVLIETSTPGVTLDRRFGSIDGSHHAAFSFDDVRVPIEQIIGEPGGGTTRAMGQINQVRMSIAATCVGLTLFVVQTVDQHLRTPDRSGQLRGASERARLGYGDIRLRAYAARSVLYRTARLVDRSDPERTADAINEVAAAKVLATETIDRVIDMAIQMVGGEALVEGHPFESILRRVRSLRLAEGESDLLRTNIARGALDLDRGRL